MKILHFPLFRIALGFILGILFFKWFQPNPALIFGNLWLCLGILTTIHFLSKRKAKLKPYFGIFALLLAFLTGISTAIIHKETYHPKHYTNQIADYEKNHWFEISIGEKLKNTPKNSRYIAKIKALDGEESFGKIILNIRKPNRLKDISEGRNVKIYGTLFKNQNPINPNQFDYRKYLENQEIYAQLYTDESQILIGKNTKTIATEVSDFRNKIIKNLELSDITNEELNILIALLLGQQQDISPEVLKDYQYAGAVHILSVSGLHVGFILLFVTFLLQPIPNSKKGSALKLVLILISLWFFGFLAGLAPSVVRSVTMFSIVAIGNHLRRTVNIFHTLTVSMLVILLFKPSFLFDVGFQLSYLALFFILWLQPMFSRFWQPKNRIIRYFWDIIMVSFAAQIGAMPLSIYYFHQFPGLFFISNLLVLPLLGIIMISGLVVVFIAAFGTVPIFIAKTLEFLIELLNQLIHWVASFEDFVLRNISFTHSILLASYLALILGFLWLEKPNFKRLTATLLCILLLQGIYFQQKHYSENQKELIVFHTKKHSLITENTDGGVTVFSNDSMLQNLEKNMAVQSYLVGNFSQLKEKRRLQNVLYFKNKKILIIDSTSVYLKNIKPDILILSHSPKLNLDRFVSIWKPKLIIADGSNYKSYIKLWATTCRKAKIPFHNTGEKGFYKL